MLNIEKYKDEFKINIERRSISCVCYKDIMGNEKCHESGCTDCRKIVFEWLLKEYKEKIKLTKFEYDLLDSYELKDYSFYRYNLNLRLKQRGHFKNVTDTEMTIQEILDNCEVIEDGNLD